MSLALIAAISKNGVIGRSNDLPWRLPDDMKYFRETTKGHAVIMGRKNYESVPEKFKPLPYRVNIIVTRQKDFVAPGCHVVHSIEEGIKFGEASNTGEIFNIGGAEVFKLGLPLANRMFLTEIRAEVEGDVYFPEYDRKEWKEVSRIPHGADDRHAFAFDFVVYERLR